MGKFGQEWGPSKVGEVDRPLSAPRTRGSANLGPKQSYL